MTNTTHGEEAMERSPSNQPAGEGFGLTVAAARERFFEHRRVRVTEGTLKTYRDRLAAWIIWREQRGYSPFVKDIDIEEFRAFLVYLTKEHIPYQNTSARRAAKRMEPASIDGTYRVLQTFWNFLSLDDLLTDAQARFFQGQRLQRPVVPEEPRPVYGTHTLERLLAACELDCSAEEAARNRAIIRVLYDTGARINEVCSLKDEDVDAEERTAIVFGKGRKYRFIFWTGPTAMALSEYLALRRGTPGGPLFRRCGNDPDARAIGADSFRAAAKRIATRAGLKLYANAPVHAFRHAFARRALDLGMEGLQLQQLLGHSSIRTTERYVRENPARLRQIYRRFFGE